MSWQDNVSKSRNMDIDLLDDNEDTELVSVSFRIKKTEKELLKRLSKEEQCSESYLYRKALKLFLRSGLK